MKNARCWGLLAALMFLGAATTSADAGYCGAASYNCCPKAACAPSGDYCAARKCCKTSYQVVKETVWEKQNVTCCKTVYDTVCCKVPVKCWKNVYQTCYRTENYTRCVPVYKTCYREVTCKVRKPCYKTCYRTVCCKIRKPCYKTCYRDVCYTVCKPVYHTCYRTCCYKVRRPVYKTCYRDVCCTTYKTRNENLLPRTLLHRLQADHRDQVGRRRVRRMEDRHRAHPRPRRRALRLRARHLGMGCRALLLCLQARQVPHGKSAVPGNDLLPQSLVPEDREAESLLHAIRVGSEALPGALHGLPPHSVHDDEARALHGLQLG